ncbi:serine/threonine-protein kinase [Streptomyces sp. NPDC059564]|uniref:serine/threonine-protein kinase n=1 Tax=Streptomyces sp. NPDC059564 TaxID=3346865 RepID=UPI00367AE9D4
MGDVGGGMVGGRYRLLEVIGRGGMGRVWLGRDETLGRDVAVKQVALPDGVGDEQREVLLQRVVREAKAAARLNHPGIITVHDVVEHEGAPVIVMEYVTGRSLAAALAEDGGLPVRRVAEIGVLMLKALRRAHEAGIVHRDLKPDNVLLMDDRVIITDFGIAHLADATTALTHSGTIIGTPAYMSPEQLEGRPPKPAGDLWSLGATLYSAVEGRPPFTAETFTALCIAIVTQEPPAPERAGPLAPVLAALLAKDPERRATADEALAALEAVIHGAGVTGAARTPAEGLAARGTPDGADGADGASGASGANGAGPGAGAAGVPVEPRAPQRTSVPPTSPGWTLAARMGTGEALLVRGLMCIALVWAGAALMPTWAHVSGPLGIFAMSLAAAAVNTYVRPRPSVIRSWLLFLTVNTALFAVGLLLPHGWGWKAVLVNAPLLATCCWGLWWVLPGGGRNR